jgi:hypothetical protein
MSPAEPYATGLYPGSQELQRSSLPLGSAHMAKD